MTIGRQLVDLESTLALDKPIQSAPYCLSAKVLARLCQRVERQSERQSFTELTQTSCAIST